MRREHMNHFFSQIHILVISIWFHNSY